MANSGYYTEPKLNATGGGSSLTIREADGTPSGVVTELVFPNTSVAIASGVGTLSVVPLFDTSITGGRNAFIVEPPPVAGQQANFLFESHSGPSGDDFGIARILANAEEGIQLVAKGNGGSDPSYNLSILPTGYAVTQASNFRTAIDAAASSHTHGNISNAGAIGTTADLPISTTASGVLAARTVADFRALLGLATTDSPTFSRVVFGELGSLSNTTIHNGTPNTGILFSGATGSNLSWVTSGVERIRLGSGGRIAASDGIGLSGTAAVPHVLVLGDAANILAQRNGTNAQISRIYKTFMSATNFETYEVDAASDASNYRIGSRIGSAGGTTRGLQFGTINAAGAWTSWLTLETNGDILFGSSNCRFQTAVTGNDLRCTTHLAAASGLWCRSGSVGNRAHGIDWDGTNLNLITNSVTVASLRNGASFGMILPANLTFVPSASRTLDTNGQFSIEMTSNTAGNLVYRGNDGTTRRMALTFS